MITVKAFEDKMYVYDSVKKLYLNPITNKWIVRPRKNIKGKSIGKSISVVNYGYNIYDFDIIYSLNIEEQERMNLFLTKLLQKYNHHMNNSDNESIFNISKNDYSNGVYVYFSLNEIEYLLGTKYIKAIKYLIDNGYVVKKLIASTKNDNFLHTYIPTKKLIEVNKIITKIKSLRVHKSLLKFYKVVEKQLGSLYYLFEHINSYSIDIDKNDYLKIVENKYPKYVEDKIYKKEKYFTLEEYKNRSKFIFENILFFNSIKKYERLDFFRVDSFSGRFHSIYSNIPKGARMYITGFDCSLDLKQSQMCFLGKILLDEIGSNSFTDDVNNCDIYEKIMKLKDINNRDIAKKYMFHILFGPAYGIYHDEFCKMYPTAGGYITELKKEKNNLKKNHSILAQKLQLLEVEAFSEIWKKLFDLKIKFIPVHDELLINKKDKDIVTKIIKETLNIKLKGINYEINSN